MRNKKKEIENALNLLFAQAKENHLTYIDLAKELGVSKQTIAFWANGLRTPNEKHLNKKKLLIIQ